jgi:hypothetical protein
MIDLQGDTVDVFVSGNVKHLLDVGFRLKYSPVPDSEKAWDLVYCRRRAQNRQTVCTRVGSRGMVSFR